jgi:hypothetical protein
MADFTLPFRAAVGDEPQLPPYRYTPIPGDRGIRTLRLHPADDFYAPLRCSIVFAALDDADPDNGVDYTALSYSWDAQTPSRLVECDGGKLLVTKNCASAMRQLRGHEGDETLWIDSICIDQSAEAVDERNHQVALMADI